SVAATTANPRNTTMVNRRPTIARSTSAASDVTLANGNNGSSSATPPPHGGADGEGVGLFTHGHREGIPRMWVVRQIEFGGRLLIEAAIFDIADDAYHRLWSVTRAARELCTDSNPLSNRIESGEEPLCRSLVDENDFET